MLSKLLKSAVLLLCGAIATTFFGSVQSATKEEPADGGESRHMHVVVFRTMETTKDGKAEVDEFVSDAHAMLGKIRHFRSFSVGRPAPSEQTTVGLLKDLHLPYALDAYSYDVAIVAVFDDFVSLKKYLDDPLFAKFAAKHDPRTKSIMAFDFVTSAK